MTDTPTEPASRPRVSIGLPVYNGQRFLSEALDSLLEQTFTDFEIVICDNASTDRTEAICREYAARDSRVFYHRNPSNIGAAANFNEVFHRTRHGDFFKWAACDDLCAPMFLERCVELLDADPGAVLAYPRTTIIDVDRKPLYDYDVKLDTDSERPVRRFQLVMGGHKCYEIFGLIRRDALARTPLMGAYSHGDGVLLARLALLGRLEQIPEQMFFSRRHEGQSATMEGDRQKYAVWFAPHLEGKRLFPVWRTYYEYFRSIHLTRGLSLSQRLLCYRRFWFRTFGARGALFAELAFQVRRRRARFPKGAGRPAAPTSGNSPD